MAFFVNPGFWIVALAVYLLIHVELPVRPTLKFGALNMGALFVIFGYDPAAFKITVFAFIYTFVIWLLLRRRDLFKNTMGTAVLAVFLVSCVFVLHKLNLENRGIISFIAAAAPWSRAETVMKIFAGLGFSYVFLRTVDLAKSVGWEDRELLDPVSLFGYLMPFHALASGPVNNYREHIQMNARSIPAPSFSRLLLCANEITTGLFYKFVVAESLRIFGFGLDKPILSSSLADTILLVFYIYFDFAGYSLVAIGIGKLTHVPTPNNFNQPIMAKSVTDFWNRWHMSLGGFVRNDIFIPLQLFLGRRFGAKRAAMAGSISLAASFSFVGLWHRFDPRFLLWGVGMGAVMIAEKTIRDKAMRKGWTKNPLVIKIMWVASPVYVFVVIMVSAHLVINGILAR